MDLEGRPRRPVGTRSLVLFILLLDILALFLTLFDLNCYTILLNISYLTRITEEVVKINNHM